MSDVLARLMRWMKTSDIDDADVVLRDAITEIAGLRAKLHPPVREIMEHFGFRSPNGAMCHIRALEKKGLLRRRARQTRGIEVVS
jgi:SOS-response transcriptional repressor LexA